MKPNLLTQLTVISPFGRRNKTKRDKISIELYNRAKGYCRWCKRTVSMKGIPHNPFNATADHLYSKNDIRRALCDKTVLSCFRCNQKRNKREVVRNDKEYLKLCFSYLSPFVKLEYTSTGKLLINDWHHDRILTR